MKNVEINELTKYRKKQKLSRILSKLFFITWHSRFFGFKNAVYLRKNRANREVWLEACYKIYSEDFSDIIDKYRKIESRDTSKGKKYVWVYWMQGYEGMPETVRMCLESIKRHVGQDVEVVVLSQDNLWDWIEVPEHIWQKVLKGKISLTHFSDVVRFELLYRYGGLWIDSTVLVSSDIPDKYFDMPLYTVKLEESSATEATLLPQTYSPIDFYGRVTSFLIGGNAGNPLFGFVLEMFYKYWEKYDRVLEGHPINICYAIAYREFEWARKWIDAIDRNNIKVEDLFAHLNDEYSQDKFEEIVNNQVFNKLTWKVNFNRVTDAGKETMYGHICNVYKEQEK